MQLRGGSRIETTVYRWNHHLENLCVDTQGVAQQVMMEFCETVGIVGYLSSRVLRSSSGLLLRLLSRRRSWLLRSVFNAGVAPKETLGWVKMEFWGSEDTLTRTSLRSLVVVVKQQQHLTNSKWLKRAADNTGPKWMAIIGAAKAQKVWHFLEEPQV